MMFCKDGSHLNTASWASDSFGNIRGNHSKYLDHHVQSLHANQGAVAPLAGGMSRAAACMRMFVLLCEDTSHLPNLRPPALSIEIQTPMGKGLEWGGKCPRDLAHSMADLLLL